jgi:2-keto-4-pentenoate hydratase/2-oxohepta-3-ene-1,7-dioic acid hydratase in catechol pathway
VGPDLQDLTPPEASKHIFGDTSDMLFSISEMLAYFSRHMTLLPGDLLATGTQPSVGFRAPRRNRAAGRLKRQTALKALRNPP